MNFIHRQSAHCESGSTSNLLRHSGIDISEPLVFGIGAGLFFGYFPFVKIHGLPLVTYRSAPGSIMKKNAKRLGLDIKSVRFNDPEKAMDALDDLIERGIPAALQTGVYWLPYLPDALRFHFNAHTIIVYGKQNGDYLISDPVLDTPVTCSREDLKAARFAKGALAPKGRMHCLLGKPRPFDLESAIKKGIMDVCRAMTGAPIPVVGVKAIEYLSRQTRKWPEKFGKRRASQYLSHTIRMQEEIGTGGGGFRFMYAAFLQEAGHILNNSSLLELSKRMTGIGDAWRRFAAAGARICKNRPAEGEDYNLLSEMISDCAVKERQLYRELKAVIK
jgi:hypothetical protein